MHCAPAAAHFSSLSECLIPCCLQWTTAKLHVSARTGDSVAIVSRIKQATRTLIFNSSHTKKKKALLVLSPIEAAAGHWRSWMCKIDRRIFTGAARSFLRLQPEFDQASFSDGPEVYPFAFTLISEGRTATRLSRSRRFSPSLSTRLARCSSCSVRDNVISLSP